MGPYDDMLLCLHRDWKSGASATARFADLHDVHWHQPPGAPHSMVHGYVLCTQIASGGIPHDCDPVSAPHRLDVCVLKKHAMTAVYAELARVADRRMAARPGRQPIDGRNFTRMRAGGL